MQRLNGYGGSLWARGISGIETFHSHCTDSIGFLLPSRARSSSHFISFRLPPLFSFSYTFYHTCRFLLCPFNQPDQEGRRFPQNALCRKRKKGDSREKKDGKRQARLNIYLNGSFQPLATVPPRTHANIYVCF